MDQNIVVYASKTNWYSFYQADTSPKTVLTSYLIDILSKYDSIKGLSKPEQLRWTPRKWWATNVQIAIKIVAQRDANNARVCLIVPENAKNHIGKTTRKAAVY